MSATLKTCVAKLAAKTVLVIGDVMLDEYIAGRATRMSREAPVPVLELESKRYIAGGAANPAANIVGLGSHAIQVGVVGADGSGKQLVELLQTQGTNTAGILICDDRPTTVKTRILAQMGLRFPQQVTRIDTISRQEIDHGTESRIIAFVRQRIDGIDAVLLSHYHAGLLTKSLVRQIRQLCLEHNVLITCDVQGHFDQFTKLDVIKSNAEDAQRYLNCALNSDDDFCWAASQLHQQLDIKRATIITRGNKGATIATGKAIYHCAAPNVSDVFDTVGAGDTAIAVITLALAADVDERTAVKLANYASGIVVQHLGNYAPSPAELLSSIDSDDL